MKRTRLKSCTLVALIGAAGLAGAIGIHALTVPFDLKDPKDVNSIAFELDSRLEPIIGMAGGLSGSVVLDLEKPANSTGSVIVDAGTLKTYNTLMTGHMQGEQWMDVKKYPTIEFKLTRLENVRKRGKTISADAIGEFTCRGITKQIKAPVTATYLKDELGAKLQGAKGDLLVVRTKFTIKRSDYGINPKAPEAVVSDVVQVRASFTGMSRKG